VIGPEGESLGIMSSYQANQVAMRYNLDLYCVAPNANPPVCKILNYGKFLYEQKKQAQANKKKQHVTETKQVQLHLAIGQHDADVKAKHAREFLEDGDKVQVCVVMKGREMSHKELGEDLMKRFVEPFSDVANVEKAPSWEGKWYSCVLAPKSKKQ